MPAPQHSVSAAIRVISDSDHAWDNERIAAECNALKESRGQVHEHPVFSYLRGETRFDLDAPAFVLDQKVCAREYLRPDVRPIVWLMRRLRIAEVAACRDIGGRDGQLRAFRKAIRGVENAPPGVTIPPPGLLGEITDAEADAIAEQVGAKLVFEAGESALLASEAPTSAEKKP